MPSHTKEEREKRRRERLARENKSGKLTQGVGQQRAQEFIGEREKRATALDPQDLDPERARREAGVSISERERLARETKEREAKLQKSIRLGEQFLEEEDITGFREELKGEIEDPLSLKPTPLGELVPEFPAIPQDFPLKVLKGELSSDEIISQIKKTSKGLAITVGIAAAIAGSIALAVPVAQATSQTVIGSAITKNIVGLNKILGGIAIGFGLGKLTDIERGEITTARKRITRITEQGERLVSAVSSNLDPVFAIQQVRRMSNVVDQAEATLKKKGEFNIVYRDGDEWIDDMEDIADARIALERRLGEIEGIILTGTAKEDPDQLIMNNLLFE